MLQQFRVSRSKQKELLLSRLTKDSRTLEKTSGIENTVDKNYETEQRTFQTYSKLTPTESQNTHNRYKHFYRVIEILLSLL